MRIEHLLENVIANIVMLLAYLKRSGATLAVKQAKADEVKKKAKIIKKKRAIGSIQVVKTDKEMILASILPGSNTGAINASDTITILPL